LGKHPTVSSETCDYEITSEELPAGLDGWSCGREVWTAADQEFLTKCIQHTEQVGKPADELIAALRADWKKDVETEPWARRLDGAFLAGVNFRNLYDVPFSDFTLAGAHLEGVNLEETILDSADLRYTDLTNVR
jgi:uncharacterized protein YjbI with pentapeptide repeats